MLLSVPFVGNPFAQVTASRRVDAVMFSRTLCADGWSTSDSLAAHACGHVCSRTLRADGWSTVCIVSPCWGALSNLFLLGNGDDILLRHLKTAAA